MDLDKLKLFKMALTSMDWAAQRQKLLAQNISNADTPSYKPNDLKPVDFKSVLLAQAPPPVEVARTDPRHLKGTIPDQDKFRNVKQDKTFEESPDGNKVVVEEQMQKVDDTSSTYDTAVTIMLANLKMLSIAIKGGGS